MLGLDMQKAKKITVILIATTFISWIGWDIVVSGYRGATESEVIKVFSYHQSWFPFAIGILMAHLFLNARDRVQWWRPGIIFPASVALVFGIETMWSIDMNPAWPFIVGLAAGRWIWPQNRRYEY